MNTYVLGKSVNMLLEPTVNVSAVAEMFGLGHWREQTVKLLDQYEVTIGPGQVVYVTGGSGTGKTMVLEVLKGIMNEFIDLDLLELPADRALVNFFDASLSDALKRLSLSGLSGAFAMLRTPSQLSDGQRYRFRLALAMQSPVIFIDECCATLDHVTAAVVTYNIRKFADTYQTTFIVATGHDDLLEDRCPDVVILKHFVSQTDVFYPPR